LSGAAAYFVFESAFGEHLANLKIFARSLLRGRLRGGPRQLLGNLRTLASVGVPMAARYLATRRIYNPADLGTRLRVVCEQQTVRESALHLCDERDALGMPLVALDWRINGAELETIVRTAEHAAAYLDQSGLARVRLDPALCQRDPALLDRAVDTYHHLGMARMATDPDTGVVDAELRVHGTDGLYVAGAAVFPSAGFANPTFTALALADRLAEHLATQARP
jgi:choline dehydrogenase-like flavoprotein